MATELAVVSNANLAADYRTCFEPTNFEQALKFAEYLSKSDLVPNDYRGKPANIFVAMQHGKELGLSPLQAVQSIANINGRPGVFGDTQLALVQVHPEYEWHKEWIEGVGDKMVAHFQVKRRGQDVHESTFSVDDAKIAGLWDPRPTITKRDGGTMQNPSPWHCYPKVMLKFRARGFGLRDKFADAMKGLKSAEELADYSGETIEGQVSEPVTSQAKDMQPKSAPMAVTMISQDEAREFAKTYKASGFAIPEAKAALKDICGVESSLDITKDKYRDVMRWASKNPNWPDPVSAVGPDEKIVRELFAILGYDLARQAAAIDESKGDWAGLAMKLNKELPVE